MSISKKTSFTIVSLIFIVVFGIYYHTNNSKSTLENTRDHISTLIEKSKTEAPLKYSSDIEDVNQDILITPEIKKWFKNDFLITWQKSIIKDTAKTNAYHSQNNTFFQPLIHSVTGVSNNQLLATILISFLVCFFFALALFSNILRDIVSDPVLKQQIQTADNFPPFSLSRSQLGVWITIIASVYLYAILWNQCRLADIHLNTTALILMGISSGTFAIGAMIDTTEIEQGTPRNQNQLSSGNFFKDILSDSQGISIHRFQNVVWTFVAIIVYFYAYNNHIVTGCLPDLDSTLLALTGISSATYLTLKTRENIFDEVKIHLNFDASALNNKATIDSQGWTEIKVTLQDATGKQVTATPDSTSMYDFIMRGLTSGNYIISVLGKANIGGTDTEFVGTYNGAVSSATVQPIVILISKK